MKSLGFSEAKINWAIEDAVQFQNGAFSRTSQNPLSRKIPRHKVMISAFLTVTIALITVSILAHNVLYDSPTAMYFAFATLVLIEAASFFWAYKSAESHRSYSTDNSTYYFISAVLVIFVTLLFASLGYLLSRLLVTIFFVTILACTIAGAFCYLYSLSTLEVPPPSMRKTIDLTFSAKGSKVYFTIGVYEPYELIAYQHISIVTKRCRSGVSFLQNVKKISYICLLSFEINPADSLLLPHRMDVHINNNTLMVNQSNYYTFV